MKTPTNRRNLLKTAGATALAAAAAAGQAVAQPMDVQGVIEFAGEAKIPDGYLKVRLEDPSIRNKAQRRVAEIRIKSRGDDEVPFSLRTPSFIDGQSKLEVVVRLEREDGWLIARGSAQFQAGTPVRVTLNSVQY